MPLSQHVQPRGKAWVLLCPQKCPISSCSLSRRPRQEKKTSFLALHVQLQAPASGSTKGGSVPSSPTGQEALSAPSCLPWCLHTGHSFPAAPRDGTLASWGYPSTAPKAGAVPGGKHGKPGCCNELQSKPQQTHRALAPEGLCSLQGSLPYPCQQGAGVQGLPRQFPVGIPRERRCCPAPPPAPSAHNRVIVPDANEPGLGRGQEINFTCAKTEMSQDFSWWRTERMRAFGPALLQQSPTRAFKYDEVGYSKGL